MARVAKILAVEPDHEGNLWDIREYRDSGHGWPILFGWPHGYPRGMGGVGGPRVILTAPLVDHLEARRRCPDGVWGSKLTLPQRMELPLGHAQLKSLRRTLGHDRILDSREWWEERAHDLATLMGSEFSAKHGRSQAAADLARMALFGPRRGPGWYHTHPEADSLIRSRLPNQFVAEKLGIPSSTVWSIRKSLGLPTALGTLGRRPANEVKNDG